MRLAALGALSRGRRWGLVGSHQGTDPTHGAGAVGFLLLRVDHILLGGEWWPWIWHFPMNIIHKRVSWFIWIGYILVGGNWLPWILHFPINIGNLIIPIDLYFSEGWPWPTNQYRKKKDTVLRGNLTNKNMVALDGTMGCQMIIYCFGMKFYDWPKV